MKDVDTQDLIALLPAIPESGYIPVLGQNVVDTKGLREGWLGKAAVWGDETPIASSLAHDRAAHIGENTRIELSGIRDNLGKMGEGQRMLLEPYLSQFYDPSAIVKATGHTTISSWLGDKKEGASDDTLVGFLEHHAQEVRSQSKSERLISAIYELKARRYALEKLGTTQGWLSEYAGGTAGDIYDINVVIGDAWDAAINQKSGYNYLGTKWLVVGQQSRGREGEDQLIESMSRRLFDHEVNHIRFDGNKNLPRFEREGLAEHVALVMQDKGDSMSVMDPDIRARNSRASEQTLEHKPVYYEERKLLSLELSAGYINIDPKVAMRAYTSSGESSFEFSEYEQCLDSSWGVDNFRGKITGLIDRCEDWVRSMNPDSSEEQVQNTALDYAQNTLKAIAECQKEHPLDAPQFAETLLSTTSWQQAS